MSRHFSQPHYSKLAKALGVSYRELREEGASSIGARRVQKKIIDVLTEDSEYFDAAHFMRVIREEINNE